MPEPLPFSGDLPPIALSHQARRRYAQGFAWSSRIPPLGWDGYLLWNLLSGEVRWTIDGAPREIGGGTCMCLPVTAADLRMEVLSRDGAAVQWLHLEPRAGAELPLPAQIDLTQPPLIEHLLQRAVDAAHRHPDLAAAGLRAALYEMLIDVEVVALRAHNQDEFAMLLWRLQQHPEEDWSVERMADRLRCSQRTVHAHFAERCGCTPHAFVTRMRIERAQELLANTDHGLRRIASDLGYCDQFSFSNAFKRLTGERPSAWRKRRGETSGRL